MTKKKIILFIILFLVIILAIGIYSGHIVFPPKVERYFGVPCPNCNSNLNDVSDCYTNLDVWKDNADLIAEENKLGISIGTIQKVVKMVSVGTNSVQCRYYGQPSPLF